MAAATGGAKPSLIDRLLAEPHSFSFFQAVRLLEKQCPDAVDIGHQGPPTAEAVRLSVDPELGFPKSDIAAVEAIDGDGGPAYRLTATFMGLHGSSSPLPTFYAEDVLHDLYSGGTLRAFLDIFHHRLLSLFYRSWIRFRHHFLFEPGGVDEFSRAIFALVGLGDRNLIESSGFAAARFMQFAGLITQKPHSAATLRGILEDFFGGIPVCVVQAIGRWLAVAPDQRATLGVANCRLGKNLSIGERIYDRLSKFRLVIGALDFAMYRKFLPGGEWNTVLKKIVNLYTVDILDFDVELILRADQTPHLGLDLSGKSQLGWTTGFYTEEKVRKDVSVVFA